MHQLTIGTRGSLLAINQAQQIKNLLESSHTQLTVDLKIIKTTGDKIQDKPLPEIGNKGLFTAELESELLEHEIDLAVHSLKDLPTQLPSGLIYAGSPNREDPRDAFISQKWHSIKKVPKGGTIATGSSRRKAQLLGYRKDLNIVDLRGNIDTRLKKLQDGNWDGIIMASAALKRLGLDAQIAELLDIDWFTPSAGQGAIGLEIADNRIDIASLINAICHKETTMCCSAERNFLAKLEGGCSTPIGCNARVENGKFIISGFLAAPDGSRKLQSKLEGAIGDVNKLSLQLAHEHLNNGAKEILSS